MHKTNGNPSFYEIDNSDYLHPKTNLLRVRQDVKVTNGAHGGSVLKRLLGELLHLLSGDGLHGLANLVDLVGLATLDETSTSKLKGSLGRLAVLEFLELGKGLSLGEVLVADTAGDRLQGVDDRLGALSNVISSAGEGDAEETGVRVDFTLGLDLEGGRALSGLEEAAGARGPLDARGATEKGSENGGLGLVGRAGGAA